MKNIFKNMLISLGASFLIAEIQQLLGSTYIIAFLKQNLVSLMIALIAINSATLGIVLTKIRELIDRTNNHGSFIRTKKEMILSINEQISLVGISLLLFSIEDSVWLTKHSSLVSLVDILIISCFVFALIILYDTAKSIFVIIDYKGDSKDVSP